MTDTFPRRVARTRRFSLGVPRGLTLDRHGERVVFLRSRGGEDPVTCLWLLDPADGTERCVADPRTLGESDADPDAERARRERMRETAEGITTYATDRAVRTAAFSVGGRLFVADLVAGTATAHPCPDTVVDPRPSPDGASIAYVADGTVRVVDTAGTAPPRTVAGESAPLDTITWGLPEFVAAEEMGRQRGFWWSPDSLRLAVTRVDTAPVSTWHLADPADPARPPRELRYPAAGTANATVRLFVVDLEGARREVVWDDDAYPYLTAVRWEPVEDGAAPVLLHVQSRDQQRTQTLLADPIDGAVRIADEQRADRLRWLELVPGAPRRLDDGRILDVVDDPATDTRRLTAGGGFLSPAGLQVRALLAASATHATVTASHDDPTAVGVWRVPLDDTEPEMLTTAEGVHSARVAGDNLAVSRRTLHAVGPQTTVRTGRGQVVLSSMAADAGDVPPVRMLRLGLHDLRVALLLPRGHSLDGPPLPVLCDPYGGPHAQRVLADAGSYLLPQWFADQGFAVLVADGRGSPGRGPTFEQAVAGALLDVPLDDQVAALHAAAEQVGCLDLDRVAIRGWSFGGYLAAGAVLRRPDVFHAAVAGAPVTDWRLYDTHYTERYLGQPDERASDYDRASLLRDAERLERPLLLIHGLADDNVVVAHTLQLSRALLEAGRWHTVLPLSAVTHMTPQESVAENLLHLQRAFLHDALA